jgi:hypothetical protein
MNDRAFPMGVLTAIVFACGLLWLCGLVLSTQMVP